MSVLRTIWRDKRYLRSLAVVASVIAIYGVGLSYVWHWTLDDAGISYAYARHLLDGWGLVAVPGGLNVEAYSNFLWVALLAVVGAFGAAIPVAAKWLGAAFGLVAILAGIRVVQRLEARRWWDLRIVDLTPAVTLSLAAGFIVWVPSGMENALFAALLMALVIFDLRERRDPDHFAVTGLIAAAVALTRPEGIMYVGAAGLFKVVDAVGRPAHRRQLAQFAAAALLPLAVYHAWHYLWFERPFPNTYYAKDPGVDAEKLADGWSYLKEQLFAEGWLYLTPLAAFGAIQFRRRSRMLVAILAGTVAFILISGGDWVRYGRFLSFGLPAFATLVHLGISRLVVSLADASGPGGRYPGLVESALAAGAVASVAVYWGPQREDRLESIEEAQWCHFCDRREDARALRQFRKRIGEPVATVLTHDFGGFAWEANRRFHPLDFLGLADHNEARVRSIKDTEGKADVHRHRLQYVFHERPAPPTFLYFPRAWWDQLRAAGEYRDGYLPVREEIDHEVDDEMLLAAHRSAWIDYFPALGEFRPRERVGGLRLWEAALTSEPEPGAGVAVRWTVAPIEDWSGDDRLRWRLRFRGDAGVARSKTFEVFDDHPGFADHWRAGEPVTRERTVGVPAKFGDEIRVELGLRVAGEWQWTEMTAAAETSEEVASARRFPDNLPAPHSERLRSLEARVDELVRRRRRKGDVTIAASEVAEKLEALGDERAAAGDDRQAYLAYVLALQADRSRSAGLAPKIWAHRSISSNASFRLELALWRRLYRTGQPIWALRLGEWYAARGDRRMAAYVADRLPDEIDEDGDRRRADQLRRALAEGDIGSEAFSGPFAESMAGGDFESESLGGWTREGDAFGGAPHRVDDDHWPVVRGHRGDRFVSSWRPDGNAGTGQVVSPTVTLETSTLGFLVGGSDSTDVGVELVVDGDVVRRTTGNASTNLRPVFWEVEKWKGREARIRIVDETEDGYVLADWFRFVQ